MTRLSIFARTTALITGLAFTNAAVTSTVYRFTAVPGSGAIGSIEFSSPPSTDSGAWGTGDASDIVMVDFILKGLDAVGEHFIVTPSDFAPPYVLFVNRDVVSDDGSELDEGILFYDMTLVIDEPNLSLTFSSAPGADTITYASPILFLQAFGDWHVVQDTDNDGIEDTTDNCIVDSNPDQRDTDADDIGNFCDPDVAVPNDCTVNFADLNVYRDNFFQTGDLDTDNNGDGQTNFADLDIVRNLFFGPPGPSAVGCN